MSHFLQLVIKLALLTLLLRYRDGANNYFNDLFLLNTELIQPEKYFLKWSLCIIKGYVSLTNY